MSEHDQSRAAQGNESVRFEPTDIATRPIVFAVVSLAVTTLVFTFAAHLTYFGFAARERASSPSASPLAEYAVKEPPEPRLQIHPKSDLDVLRAAEARSLGTLAWVDKDAGVVQVPIERAMQLLLAKGVPARQAPVPLKMQPQGVAPAQMAEGAGAPDWWGGFRLSHDEHEAEAGGHQVAAPQHAAQQGHEAAGEAHGH